MRRILFAATLLGLLAIVGIWWQSSQDAHSNNATADQIRLHTVTRQRLTVGLTENGVLQAIRHQRISSSERQQLTIAWIVEENTEVKKGDRLIEFDKKDLENRLVELDKEHVKLLEDLERQSAGQVVRQAEADAWIRDAQVGIEKAQKALQQYQFIDAPKRQRELDDALTKVIDERDKAEANASQAQEKEDASAFESAQKRADLERQTQTSESQIGSIEKRIEDAMTQRAQFRSRACPEELSRLRREIERAMLTLDKEKARAREWVTSGEQAQRNPDKQITRNRKQASEIKKTIENCLIVAPIDGIVLYGDPENDHGRMSQYLAVGKQTWGGDNVMMSIPDMSSFVVTVPIPEHYRGRVQPNSEALITIPAIPGLTIKGRLMTITTMARSREEGNPSSPKVFRGKIEMDASDRRMVSGMSAKITLIAKVIEDCLCVPIESVWTEGDTSYVYVESGTGIERREVETGSVDDRFVEILRGLQVGEKVWLYEPASDGHVARPGLVKLPPTSGARVPNTASATTAAPTPLPHPTAP